MGVGATTSAAGCEIGVTHESHRVLPRRPVQVVQASGQVSWLSDRPTPHAFPVRPYPNQWLTVGFVPDYSDGVAADSHRLPWGPHLAGHPDAATTYQSRDPQSTE